MGHSPGKSPPIPQAVKKSLPNLLTVTCTSDKIRQCPLAGHGLERNFRRPIVMFNNSIFGNSKAFTTCGCCKLSDSSRRRVRPARDNS
jgi:hypothetical protein